MNRITIVWTQTAVEQLRALPPKVARGLYRKADELRHCDDPRQVHKPLQGPLQGFYRIPYARYRAIYRVEDMATVGGETVVTVEVQFIAAGKRQQRSRDDIYRVAQKIVDLGIVPPPQ